MWKREQSPNVGQINIKPHSIYKILHAQLASIKVPHAPPPFEEPLQIPNTATHSITSQASGIRASTAKLLQAIATIVTTRPPQSSEDSPAIRRQATKIRENHVKMCFARLQSWIDEQWQSGAFLSAVLAWYLTPGADQAITHIPLTSTEDQFLPTRELLQMISRVVNQNYSHWLRQLLNRQIADETVKRQVHDEFIKMADRVFDTLKVQSLHTRSLKAEPSKETPQE